MNSFWNIITVLRWNDFVSGRDGPRSKQNQTVLKWNKIARGRNGPLAIYSARNKNVRDEMKQ